MQERDNKKEKRKQKNLFLRKVPHTLIVTLVFFVIIPAVGFGFWYGYQSINKLSSRIEKLSQDMDKMESRFTFRTSSIENKVRRTENSLQQLIKEKFSGFQSKFSNVSEKVSDLEKLTKTDEELLKKYSQTYFLSENYIPSNLIDIPKRYRYYEDRQMQFHAKAWSFLQEMLEAAKDDGVKLYVYSAYRSFDTQAAVKDKFEMKYGQTKASQFSADQGYSEHQLGTAADLITTGINGTLEGFADTKAYQWLKDNAYKYGFIMSYPKDNKYFTYEPWHWRFVGEKLATYLKGSDKHFYDLPQRKIDQYLVSLFDDQ